MRPSFRLSPLVLSILWFAANAYADDASDDSSWQNISLESLLNIEVTSASKFAQKTSEAPSVISVVTADQIDAYGWHSINDVLYKQPGFGPGQDYDRHTVPTRGMSDGWNNNHLLHLVDGIPMNDNLYGTAYTWEITPMFLAKSLEIIRGPGSALYGSNATNGVVQENTPSAKDLKGSTLVNTRIGNDGVRANEFLTGTDSGFGSAIVGYSNQHTDGNNYNDFDGSLRGFNAQGQGAFEKFRVRDERNTSYFWTKLQLNGALQGLSLQYHQQYWNFETGHGWLWLIPDFKEDMEESRKIFAVKYAPDSNSNFAQEYVVRYQQHNISWDQRYFPNNSVIYGNDAPNGMWEILDTSADDIFARGQWSFLLGNGASILSGIELDRFIYTGDKEHISNVDVDVTYGPFPNNEFTKLGPWLDYIRDEPLVNKGVYGQLTSGEWFGKVVKGTLGVRWDKLSFDYHDLLNNYQTESKSFSKVSPRLAFVFTASDNLTFKTMGGKAFRAPTPTEMAGAHTFSLGSNIHGLKPELITTYEGAFDWKARANLSLRGNIFHTKFENQIGYSTDNFNLSTNIFSQTNQGAELELLYQINDLSGFINYSYVKRVDEQIIACEGKSSCSIATSPSQLTGEPANKLNLGGQYNVQNWSLVLTAHFQSSVKRRDGENQLQVGIDDNAQPVYANLDDVRGGSVGSWFTMDINYLYRINKQITWGLAATNLFDTHDNLLYKSGPYPFDYRQDGRLLSTNFNIKF